MVYSLTPPHLSTQLGSTEDNETRTHSEYIEMNYEKGKIGEPPCLGEWLRSPLAITSYPAILANLNEDSDGETGFSSSQNQHNILLTMNHASNPVQTTNGTPGNFVMNLFSPHLVAKPRQSVSQDDILPCSAPPVLESRDGPMSTLWKLVNSQIRLPHSSLDPLRALLSNPAFDQYILTQQDKLMGQWYFKTVDNQKNTFRQWLLVRLQSSLASFARWIALVGMGICESFLTGDISQHHFHNLWIGHIQSALKPKLLCDTPSLETHNWRRDWVHVTLLKTVVDQTSNAYQSVRSVTPVFLELVFSNPLLWPNGSDPTYVPLLNVLTLESHELAFFVLLDCTFAMALGLPQQVDYDTTIYSGPCSSSHQWAHGSPLKFQAVLADINACRDRSPISRCWREIEHLLLTWQSLPGEYTFTESWMTIAWYAVQESWRLALLMYLYLVS
ncbi:unnamed protein product [Rhizoctonia solani]|uniref:Uncharacterized protein n=1 Tax=Rhizoctonia solani TaxID=456999 RepID=A0A8H2XWS9_9AGAM|nr:unnamed protein product [Rhizoctonia solani]